MTLTPEIVNTSDGSQTLRHPVTGETYHSVNGAVAESEHVFIRNGFESHAATHVRTFEVGFGSGLNTLLTLRAAEKAGRSVDYTAIELYPITTELSSGMAYASDPLFLSLHETPWWDGSQGSNPTAAKKQITQWFSLTKIHGDLANTRIDAIFDIVYYDAFAPDSQPGLWTEDIFKRIYDMLSPGGILVTYSAKGDVKRALRASGFEVIRLEGAPGKRHMLRAIKRQ